MRTPRMLVPKHGRRVLQPGVPGKTGRKHLRLRTRGVSSQSLIVEKGDLELFQPGRE